MINTVKSALKGHNQGKAKKWLLKTGDPLKEVHLHPEKVAAYCKTLNICGIRFSRSNENNILAYFKFGGHDIPWLQIVKKM